MEMPGYTDYGKMYEMNPGAFFQAQEQLGLAQQFQKQKQAQAEQTTQGMGLDNMFKQDTYGDRVRKGTADADLAGYQANDAGVKSRINTATEGLQLNAEQKKLIQQASKSDLDMLEIEGQRMAYNPDPAIRAKGEKLISLHKDFIKMRAEQGFTAGENAKNRSHQSSMESQRQAGMAAREQARAKGKNNASAGTEKMTMDQRISHYAAKAQEARAAGDEVLAADLYAEAQYLSSLKAFQRPDPLAGKIDTPAIAGLPAVPPRPPVMPPTGTPQGRPTAAPPKAVLADVQKMYPGVPAEKLREAYKKKFGVDLQ